MLPTWTCSVSSFCSKSIAPGVQKIWQALHLPLLKYVQAAVSMTGYLGTACGKGR